MGRSKSRQSLKTVLAVVVAALVVVPAGASAFADRGAAEGRGAGAGADAGDALTRQAEQAQPGAKHTHEPGLFQNSIVEAGHVSAEADGPMSKNPTLPTGFSDQEVIGGMSEAVSADFAPDGTAFIALKTGQIKVSEYSSTARTWATVTDFADLQTQVQNYGDRGLTGIAVDPQFPTRPYVYVNYTYDKDPRDGAGGVVPKWGKGTAYDDCQTPAVETNTSIAGCITQDRVTRLTAVRSSNRWVLKNTDGEKELLVSGCYQFSSHASGDVAFGPDGKLYASSGDGASFNTQDYGQFANACGDPANEGGALRSQDYRSASDPLGVDGSVFRMDPDAGVVPTQANANQWLVAYGQRNPWRLTFRPKADGSGTSNELWSGDVGASRAEEVNRIADVTAVTSPVNRGWPCYEGNYVESAVQPAWDALDKNLCESLYSQGLGAVQKPVFSYQTRDGGPLVTGEDCANETSSVSGVAFPTAASNYPAAYKGAMFFSDFARSCVWMLGKKSDGEPDPTKISTFVQAAATPVDLLTGPGGDLYYVDYGLNDEGVAQGEAGVHRIVYTGSNATPTARITADKLSGAAPLTVNFSGATSSDPDGDALTYRWDFDNNGTWDANGVSASHQYAANANPYTVKLEVNDGQGHTHNATEQVQAGNTAPVLGTVTPAASLTWAVGDQISYSATATDQQQGTMPSSAFSWRVEIRHCPSGVCHTHPFGTYTGATGSFTAPPHEYPSHLLVTATVTDSGGLTDSRTVQLNPKTVDLTFASSPSGASMTVGEAAHPAPYTETFIQKSPVTVTAAPTTGSGTTVAAFSSWSDGGARSHTVTPGSSNSTLTATYTRPTAALAASPTSGPAPLTVTYTASATNAAGVTGAFSYAWDLDNDGQYDDGTGATQSRTHATPGSPVVSVRATDSRGATDAKSATVTVGPPNQNPVAAASANPTSGKAPLAVSFSAAGSTDPDGDPLGYAWDLDNDGAYDDATGPTASRTYTGVGAKPVGVRVTDGRGGAATKSLTVTVTNSGPTARVTTTPSPATGNAPLPVTFSGSTSSDPDGGALTYAWDLDGDGQFDDGNQPTASRTYGVGTVTVGLRVTDAHAATSTAFIPVTVANRAPVAAVSANPASGPAPLTPTFSAAGSSDPDGTALTYAWDLDDDGAFDDATGLTASRSYSEVGPHEVTVQVKDADSGTATKSMTVTVIAVANTAPTVTRVSTYPEGTWYVGQTLGFDALATDPQEELPSTAYSFVMERQDCDSGCPRVVVQRWTGVNTGRFVVPPMAYPSHLYLTATATDAQGATGSRTLRVDPKPGLLTVLTRGPKLKVSVDGVDRKGGWSGSVVAGSTVRLVAPRHQSRQGVRYVFVNWTDGGARKHDVVVWEPGKTVKAVYRRVR